MKKFIFELYSKIFARTIFKKLNYALFQLSLRGLGILNHKNNIVNGEKYFITKFLPNNIKNNKPIFFDVGANIGRYTESLLEIFPNSSIYAFEPHPNNFLKFKERINSKNVIINNMAMGEKISELTLYDRSDCDGSSHASLYKEVISEIHKQDIVSHKVSIKTLDEFTKKNKIEYIDFLKIDTEGNELAVLQGATELLKNRKIGIIHFEFNEMNIVSRVFFRDFIKILSNYELYRLLPNDLLRLGDYPLSTELFGYQNIIAMPK